MNAAKAESLVRRLASLPSMEEVPGVEYAVRLHLEELIRDARVLVTETAEVAQHEADEAQSEEEAAAFNPALRDWLNARDLCSGDWPYNVTDVALREADREFGGGYILDEAGWPIRVPTHTYGAQHGYDCIYLGG